MHWPIDPPSCVTISSRDSPTQNREQIASHDSTQFLYKYYYCVTNEREAERGDLRNGSMPSSELRRDEIQLYILERWIDAWKIHFSLLDIRKSVNEKVFTYFTWDFGTLHFTNIEFLKSGIFEIIDFWNHWIFHTFWFSLKTVRFLDS